MKIYLVQQGLEYPGGYDYWNLYSFKNITKAIDKTISLAIDSQKTVEDPWTTVGPELKKEDSNTIKITFAKNNMEKRIFLVQELELLDAEDD